MRHILRRCTVYNELPADWPQVTDGISIHWHGFNMRGAEYYDGVAYLHQCPIASGTNFTYRFTVRLTRLQQCASCTESVTHLRHGVLV